MYTMLRQQQNLVLQTSRKYNNAQKDRMDRIFQIYHNLNCKSKYAIYLLECTKCKIQYEKAEKLEKVK